MRSRKEAIEYLEKLRQAGTPTEHLTIQDIIAEQGDRLLIRHTHLLPFGSTFVPGFHYEIWNTRKHYELQIRSDREGRIYCSSYATNDEKSMMNTFNSDVGGLFNGTGE